MIHISTQAFSGVVLFYGYTVYFFQQAGYDKPFEANLIFGCLQLVGTASSFFLLDLVGRRPLLIFGSGVCALCCWGLGGLAFAAEPSGKGMVALCCIWISVYSATLNSLGYTFVGDLCRRNLDSEVEIENFSDQFRGIRLSELNHGLHLSLHVVRSRVGMGIEDW
jgi:hypothetical protein